MRSSPSSYTSLVVLEGCFEKVRSTCRNGTVLKHFQANQLLFPSWHLINKREYERCWVTNGL